MLNILKVHKNVTAVHTENILDTKVNQMLNVFVQYFKVHSPETSIFIIHSFIKSIYICM